MKTIVTPEKLPLAVNSSTTPTPAGNPQPLKGNFVTDPRNGDAVRLNPPLEKEANLTNTMFPAWDVNGDEVPFGSETSDYPSGLFGGSWTFNGSKDRNALLRRTLPNGDKGLVWVTHGAGANTADGGVNTGSVPIDNTKTYRASIWVRRVNNFMDGKTYMGYHGGGEELVKADGEINSNPYMEHTRAITSEWSLMVGYIYPAGTDIGAIGKRGGVFQKGKMLSVKKNENYNYAFHADTTSLSMRFYEYYTNTPHTEMEFYQPLIEVVDGTETPISELLLCDDKISGGVAMTITGSTISVGNGDAVPILTTEPIVIKKGSDVKVDINVPFRQKNDSTSWGGLYVNVNVEINGTWYNMGNGGYENMLDQGVKNIDKLTRTIITKFPEWIGVEGDYVMRVELTARSYQAVDVIINASHDMNSINNALNSRGDLFTKGSNQNYLHVSLSEC